MVSLYSYILVNRSQWVRRSDGIKLKFQGQFAPHIWLKKLHAMSMQFKYYKHPGLLSCLSPLSDVSYIWEIRMHCQDMHFYDTNKTCGACDYNSGSGKLRLCLSYRGSFWLWAQSMRYDVALLSCLSLAEPIPKIIPWMLCLFYDPVVPTNSTSSDILSPGRVRYLDTIDVFLVCLMARFMGPTWGPSGAHRTQVGLMFAPWTLLSGYTIYYTNKSISSKIFTIGNTWHIRNDWHLRHNIPFV